MPRYRHKRPGHRLGLCECLNGHCNHGTRYLLVRIDDLGNVGDVGGVVDDRGVGADVGRVVDVRDGRRGNHRITAIDVVEIVPADRVGRLVNLSRREREPPYCGSEGTADRRRDLKVLALHKRDQGRRINRPLPWRTGHPAPSSADVRPAAIVRHRKTPGRIVDPRPAPGVNPGPVAVAIRSPVGGHVVRRPDAAVRPVGTPSAIGIEVFVADHFRGYIACGLRIVATAVAIRRPMVQVVIAPPVQCFIVRQSGAVKPIALPRGYGIRRPFAIHLGSTTLHSHAGCIVA